MEVLAAGEAMREECEVDRLAIRRQVDTSTEHGALGIGKGDRGAFHVTSMKGYWPLVLRSAASDHGWMECQIGLFQAPLSRARAIRFCLQLNAIWTRSRYFLFLTG